MSRNFEGDDVLVTRVRQDDTVSFEELYHRYFFPLYTYSLKKLGSKEDARRIVREIFVEIWENRHTLYLDEGVSAYLYAEIRRAVIKVLSEKIGRQGSYFFSKKVVAEFSVESLQKSRLVALPSSSQRNVEVVQPAIYKYPSGHTDLHKYYSWLDMKWLVNMLRIKQTA